MRLWSSMIRSSHRKYLPIVNIIFDELRLTKKELIKV